MHRGRAKSALLWGAVGALSFLVLVQGYQLLVARLPLSFGALFGLAAGLGSLVTLVAYAAEDRLTPKGRT
jgi:hypothetical protein